MRIIKDNRLTYFLNELSGTKEVRIISPFITNIMVDHLLNNFKGSLIKVITRYNLNDFKSGVSSLSALEKLLNAGAEIKSVKDLHSKLYLFDKKSAFVTSANFTNGGFFRNKEFGVLVTESESVEESLFYFKELWGIDASLLNMECIIEWRKIIKLSRTTQKEIEKLPDVGASYSDSILGGRRYFIKFFGKADNRLGLERKVLNELYGGCSHFALSFSKNKRDARPRRYREGDIVFMARMTKDPDDYAIYGRAITYAHNDKRDVANTEDIKHIPWLKDWSILVRVKEPMFINSTFEECPKLNDLVRELKYLSFESTEQNFKKGSGNINPKSSLMQKGDVMLSSTGAQWLELTFKKAIEKTGTVDQQIINSFYQGSKITE
ncbi:phospholipase D family protein [uncultured Kordia sp.]|uniref:phospholipase D family protein n=1 Tax=uncultured Kordia sp. TaxID=507699 RepID=UPI002602C1AC|nr:phospholipase D family protein [uncultured Kordia sp.]